MYSYWMQNCFSFTEQKVKLASLGVNFHIFLKWEDSYVKVVYLYLSKAAKTL